MGRRLKPRLERLGAAAGKLRRGGLGGIWLLIRAQASLLVAMLMVRAIPQGKILEVIRSKEGTGWPTKLDMERAEDAALALDRVVRFGFGRPRCLVRSVALSRLLASRSIPHTRILVGVRMNGASFEAHAWVEVAGVIVGDDAEYVGRFKPLLDPSDGVGLNGAHPAFLLS